MKASKFKLATVFAFVAFGLFAFHEMKSGSIKGTVTPAASAVKAWAISGSDTLKTNIDGGAFNFSDAKPGVYKVIIEALPPFKNIAKEGVSVMDGQATDIGEIKLQQ